MNSNDCPVSSLSALFSHCQTEPLLDSSGVIRVGGRLSKSKILPAEVQHPILLPKTSLVKFFLLDFHHKHHHPGPSAMEALLYQSYYPVGCIVDNGSNFIGAARTLGTPTQLPYDLQDFTAKTADLQAHGVSWHFIPARSPTVEAYGNPASNV